MQMSHLDRCCLPLSHIRTKPLAFQWPSWMENWAGLGRYSSTRPRYSFNFFYICCSLSCFSHGKTSNIRFNFFLQHSHKGVAKSRTTLYFLQQLFVTWYNLIRGGKTRKTSFQLVLQWRCKTSCTFYCPNFLPLTTKILGRRFQRRVPYYRKLFLINPWLKHLRRGFWKSLYPKGAYNGNRKSSSRQAIVVLVKIYVFAYTGF